VTPKPVLLSATKISRPDANQTMDSYYAKVMVNESPYHVVESFAARVATQRRSAEAQGLRSVTQADMPLSYIPRLGTQQDYHSTTKEPAIPFVTDELGTSRASIAHLGMRMGSKVRIWLIKIRWTQLISINRNNVLVDNKFWRELRRPKNICPGFLRSTPCSRGSGGRGEFSSVKFQAGCCIRALALKWSFNSEFLFDLITLYIFLECYQPVCSQLVISSFAE
jgi:hypothetical protein